MTFKEKIEKAAVWFPPREPRIYTVSLPLKTWRLWLWSTLLSDSRSKQENVFIYTWDKLKTGRCVCGVSWKSTERLTVRFKGRVARGADFKQANIKKQTQTKLWCQSLSERKRRVPSCIFLSANPIKKTKIWGTDCSELSDFGSAWRPFHLISSIFISSLTCWWKVRWSSVKSKNRLT